MYFKPYLQGGEKYMYTLKKEEGQTRLEYIGTIYYTLHRMLGDKYKETQVYQVFDRVYTEHFKAVETSDKFPIQLRLQKELTSNILQSPDDLEATFRSKRKESYQGFVVCGTETCHPDNELNLVTSLAVATNNTDDSVILEEKIDQMKEVTPDLEELHGDGGFGSEGVDIKTEKHQITLIQTAVKGATAKVPIAVQGNEEEGFTVNCPNQEHPPVIAKKAKKNWMADFQLEICQQCPFFDQCPTKKERNCKKGKAVLRFKATESLKQKRHKAIQKIPPERQTLRPGVEKLMGLMRRGEKNTGKMKIRGRFNFELYTFSMGIVINFERIFKYLEAKNELFLTFASLSLHRASLVKQLLITC
ncbi:MAG: transposase [Saprospiraceae bacterium]